VYARNVDGRPLTFAVSGMLWQRSLVMIDRETGTLWSHLLGRAMRGPLAGKELERLPAVMTDWQTWRRLHPDTTVVMLSRTSWNYRREFYRDPAAFIVGLADGSTARAWGFDQLVATPVINDRFHDTPVVVVFDRDTSTAFLFERRIGGNTLHIEVDDGWLVDRHRNMRWDPRSGKSMRGKEPPDGPHGGRRATAVESHSRAPGQRPSAGERSADLRPLPAIVSYRRAWEVLHPESTFYHRGP